MSVQLRECPYCGQMIPDHDLYCPHCGGPQVYRQPGSGVQLALDPWLITDPQAKERFAGDPVAVEALVNTWRNDPDHAHTRRIEEEISAAAPRVA